MQDDGRQQILLSTFGFLRGGSMFLNVSDFTFDKAGGGKDSTVSQQDRSWYQIEKRSFQFGFSIDKARSSRIGGYAVGASDAENFCLTMAFQEAQGRRSCGLSRTEQDADIPYIYFRIDHQSETPK